MNKLTPASFVQGTAKNGPLIKLFANGKDRLVSSALPNYWSIKATDTIFSLYHTDPYYLRGSRYREC